MKKIYMLLSIFILSILLIGCSNYKKISDDKALKIGESLFQKYLETDIYSQGINFEDKKDKYALQIKYKKDHIILKNIFSDTESKYIFKNNILKIYDYRDLEVESIKMEESYFFKNYPGIINIKLNKDNIFSHETNTIEKGYSKGNKKYYVLDQKIKFKEDIEIKVNLLNSEYIFFIKEARFEINKNNITNLYFDGYKIKEGNIIKLRYFVYKV